MCEEGDWPEEEDDAAPDVPVLTAFVDGPQVLGYLYGPDGEIAYTLVDRPVVPFGFRGAGAGDT